jgi:exo-beta-1,3-glucanase (GH17 family)
MKKLIIVVVSFLAILAFSCKKSSTTENPIIAEAFDDIFLAAQHMGVNYGPYHFDGQAPGTAIPVSQIQADLSSIAQHFKFLRTYTVEDGMDQVIPEAAAKNLQVCVGIYCNPGNDARTKADIDLAVSQASKHPGTVTAFVIGNETNLNGPNYVPDDKVASLMDYAKQKITAANLTDVSVTSCITGTGGLSGGMGDSHACQAIMGKCRDLNDAGNRIILMTIYPYYGQKTNGLNTPSDISGNMSWSYDNGMKQAISAYGLSVIIGEIGWPSQGNDPAMENNANEGLNFVASLHWINGNNGQNQAYNTFWFSMFDEPWKTNEPYGIGPYWGIYPSNGSTQSKFTIPVL